MERTRKDGFNHRDKMVKFYQIEDEAKGTFFLQVDWLLENAVYPSESGYADNLLDLWNVYMPGYEFDRVVLEYSKKYFPVLRFVHDGEIFKFNSIKKKTYLSISSSASSSALLLLGTTLSGAFIPSLSISILI